MYCRCHVASCLLAPICIFGIIFVDFRVAWFRFKHYRLPITQTNTWGHDTTQLNFAVNSL